MRANIKKIIVLLTKGQLNSVKKLLILLLFGMVVEVFGIGVLLPVLTAILTPEKLYEYDIIVRIFKVLNLKENSQIIKLSLSFLITIYAFKSIYLIFLNYIQNKFTSNLCANLSDRLFRNYLSLDYSFYLEKNTSELVKNLQVEINGFSNYLNSLIQLTTESILGLSVIITLILIEPLGTSIIILFFSILSITFHRFAKNKSSKWGTHRALVDKDISKVIIESLSGIKEIIILGRKEYFKNALENNNKVKARLQTKAMTIRQLPRYYLEFLSVFTLVVFVYVIFTKEGDLNSVIVILGVFAGAIFRILPSLNRILSALQNLKYYQSSVDILSSELKNNNPKNSHENAKVQQKPISLDNELKIEEINFSYNNKKLVLDNISFDIKRGTTIGIIGESGSGKTTLINILTGLLKAQNGILRVDQIPINNENISQWQQNIGYVSQDVFLTDDTIASNVAFGISEEQVSISSVNSALKQAQLHRFVIDLPEGLQTRVGERGVQLSGGQRQRIGIARALYKNPEVLILDEATSALDVKTEKNIMESINLMKGKKTIIIVTHRWVTLEGCDQIYVVKNGKVVEEKNLKINH